MKIKWKKKGPYIDVKFENPYNNYNLRKNIFHQYLSIFVGFFALMGAQLDRLRYEVFQNLFYSPMNTGFIRPAVITAPTVYGIETIKLAIAKDSFSVKLQQYLPFTVLKLNTSSAYTPPFDWSCNSTYRLRYWNLRYFFIFYTPYYSCNSTYRLRYWNWRSEERRVGKECRL